MTDVRRRPRGRRSGTAPHGPLPLVVQLGGAGTIAGGLSQVVEAYASWPFDALRVESVPTRRAGSPLHTALRTARAAGTIVRLAARRTGPVLLAVHVSQRGSFLREGTLARLGAALGVPYAVHVHGSGFVAFEAAHPQLVRYVVGPARAVFALDDATATRLAATAGERVVRLPNAVDVRAPVAKRRHVVFGGVVGERKGVDLLLAAWRTLGPGVVAGWELRLYGPVRMELPTLDHGVRLMGEVAHADLLDALDASTVAVLPSRAEAMPLFVLEAMAAGNAVVASDVGALPTVLAGGAGVLVPAGDVAALAAGLRAVLTDDAHRSAVAAAGLERIRDRYDARVVAGDLETAWSRAVSRTAVTAS